MDNIVQQQPNNNEGENKVDVKTTAEGAAVATPALEAAPVPEANQTATENPTAAQTEQNGENKGEQQPGAAEPTKEMTAEQFEKYNETLRCVSKQAKSGIPTRYNAFEDAEVKARVKQEIMDGKTPDISAMVADAIARHTPAPKTEPEPVTETKAKTADNATAELASLKAENALLKAGISFDRVEAATKLFMAEGGDLAKVSEFVSKYPEWTIAGKQEGGVTFSRTAPVAGSTAPTPQNQPVLNDFEKKVAAARKARGFDT